ncbi:uncharacterized protein RAG0_14818 [Rhynchosporium agropyri]|uniref:Uncharacterized protein n=1 Tax=Rhynchosporium agropyri TaxID=914238 RepID=A0A1E1LIF7_9HELO|nr:uncharacterized protein RAG0_14818 [Rhynchosporium agropyri]
MANASLDFPALKAKRGKIAWVFVVPVYWSIAYVVATAVPNIGDISSLVGVFCIGNFTYTFSALLKLGFDIQKGAMLPEEHFVAVTKKYTRVNEGAKRWMRGYRKSFWMSTWNIFYFLGSLVVCVLGCYAAIMALISAFGSGGTTATHFSCISPFAG